MNLRLAIGLGVGVFGAIWLYARLRKPPAPPIWYNPNMAPQLMGNSMQAFMNWVNQIQNLYGTVAWLWGPGGPFENISTQDIHAATDPDLLEQNGWNDPNQIPGGWV